MHPGRMLGGFLGGGAQGRGLGAAETRWGGRWGPLRGRPHLLSPPAPPKSEGFWGPLGGTKTAAGRGGWGVSKREWRGPPPGPQVLGATRGRPVDFLVCGRSWHFGGRCRTQGSSGGDRGSRHSPDQREHPDIISGGQSTGESWAGELLEALGGPLRTPMMMCG